MKAFSKVVVLAVLLAMASPVAASVAACAASAETMECCPVALERVASFEAVQGPGTCCQISSAPVSEAAAGTSATPPPRAAFMSLRVETPASLLLEIATKHRGERDIAFLDLRSQSQLCTFLI